MITGEAMGRCRYGALPGLVVMVSCEHIDSRQRAASRGREAHATLEV